jgi:hypothetical protein
MLHEGDSTNFSSPQLLKRSFPSSDSKYTTTSLNRLSAVSVLARHFSHIPPAKSEYQGQADKVSREAAKVAKGDGGGTTVLRALRALLRAAGDHAHAPAPYRESVHSFIIPGWDRLTAEGGHMVDVKFFSLIYYPKSECEGWDSNPRTPAGVDLKSTAFGRAWLPSREEVPEYP